MPRHRDQEGNATPGPSRPNIGSFKERFSALRTLRPFIAMVWRTSPPLTLSSLLLRLVRALLPVVALYIGKLIIDDVVHLVQMPNRPATFEDWLASGLLNLLGVLILAELALAVLSDILGRVVEFVDSLLSERVTNASSVSLMEHAATLDLEDFEDAEFQDQLERARRQTSGRLTLMSQLLGQAQDIVTGSTSAARPNAASSIMCARPPPASRPPRKEKIFGLNRFLIEHYTSLADAFYTANRALALRRATWGGLFTTIGTLGYYIAYAYIVWRTLVGAFSIGDLTFLAGSFLRLRSLLEGLLLGFSSTAGQALYLNDLFSFFEMRPEILSPDHALPFPKPISEGFVFEDVGFRYPGAERWAVRHLDFTLKAGEVVALVGENGAGKTTLVKLLTRLYDPDEGRILLDGRDLRDYDLDQLRSSMGVIFQDFVRYGFTAGDNTRSAASRRAAIRRASPGRRAAARPMRSSPDCRRAMASASASASRTASSLAAANGRRWRSRAPTCAKPRC